MRTQSKPHPRFGLPAGLCTVALSCLLLSTSQAQSLTEDDYMPEVPVVLTATRLLQSLHDVPGAMTVIDRDTIRRSGARDVAELLRLVPGYLFGGFNGAHPVAAYHAPLDEFGVRNLVFIDGRSVYSSFFLGDTHRGMMSVLPEDIERIEVMRGANSAAYGANAMFGVINIVTRHTNDSIGQSAQVNVGSADVRDLRASIGWGEWGSSNRLSVAQREDSGYANLFDDRRLRVLDWRADWRPQADQDIMWRAGVSDLQSGRGYASESGDPERVIQWDDWFLQGKWQRHSEDGSQWQVSADVTNEHYVDLSYYGLSFKGIPYVAPLNYGAKGQRINLELQNTLVPHHKLRVVWGAGWKQEDAESPSLFEGRNSVAYQEKRLFGHLEWTPNEKWTGNVGGLFGDHSQSGSYWTPRAMVNYHLTPEHTLRFGTNRSLRTNSLLEMYGTTYYHFRAVTLPDKMPKIDQMTVAVNPYIAPEVLNSREISYLGQIKPWHLTLDVRAYDEQVDGWIGVRRQGQTNFPREFANLTGFRLQGLEYQARWVPFEGGTLQWQQNFSHLNWDNDTFDRDLARQPPVRSSMLTWFQNLPHGFDWSLMLYERGPMTWLSYSDTHLSVLPAERRIDVRLARALRFDGGKKGEWSCTLQSINGAQTEARRGFLFEPRVFLSFRLEH